MPIIYSSGEGFDGWFESGEVGYSVNPKSVEDLKRAIVNIVSNYDKISCHATEQSVIFNWDSICDKYLDIYRSSSL